MSEIPANNPSDAPVNDWDKGNVAPRQQAVLAFCKALSEDKDLKQRCEADPGFAMTLFAKLGNFCVEGEGELPTGPSGQPVKPIPKDTKFRVFDHEDTANMDKWVLLTLPEMPLPPVIDPTEVWTCSWPPYGN